MYKRKTKYNQGNLKEGDIFGRLTSIKYLRTEISKSGKNNKPIWLFKCECGNQCETHCRNVISRGKLSCGCIKKDILTERNKSWKIPVKERATNELIGAYIKSASKRNREFKLTREQFQWFLEQDCYYCGIPPTNLYRPKEKVDKFLYNGIDRVDNSIDYIFENCVPCCKFCNKAKATYSLEEFMDWLNRLKNLYKNEF